MFCRPLLPLACGHAPPPPQPRSLTGGLGQEVGAADAALHANASVVFWLAPLWGGAEEQMAC